MNKSDIGWGEAKSNITSLSHVNCISGWATIQHLLCYILLPGQFKFVKEFNVRSGKSNNMINS